MTYWIGMGSVLLLGYGLIRWSGRANEQAKESGSDGFTIATTGKLGLRSPATVTHTSKASDQRENQSNDGGEA